MQCAKHGIAAGPDGLCAVCRRKATAGSEGGSRRVLWLGGLGLGLVTVAVVLARPLGALSSPPVSLAPEVPSAIAKAPAAEPEPQAEPEPNPEATEAAAAAAPPEPAAEPVLAEAAASAAPPEPSASAARATPSPSASQARPSEAALASAIRSTPIVMFSTDWCTVCQRARAFMDANGLRYSERDIDRDSNAREELKRLTGKASIPTIQVDGQLLTPGFNEQKIMTAVAASAQRRLGVDKIEIRSAN